MKPLRARHAIDWLHAEPAFARVGDHSRRMLDLQADVNRIVPSLPLVVVSLEQDTLVLAASNAAAAAKLRQHEPSLIAGLAAGGWKVNRIRFRPQMRILAPAPAARPTKARVPASALTQMESFAKQLQETPLKRALTNMIRRQRRTRSGG